LSLWFQIKLHISASEQLATMTDITDIAKRAPSSVTVTESEPTSKRAKIVDARDIPTGVAPVKPE
jgi:hypothetical protein